MARRATRAATHRVRPRRRGPRRRPARRRPAARRGRCPARWARTRLAAAATPDEVSGDPVDGFGLDLALAAAQGARAARRGRLDRLRRRRRLVLLLADGDDGRRHRDARRSTLAVEGDAWFDHQWGDFISVGGGGWDWFAVNLDDGTDLTVSLVRAADGSYPLIYGTLVAADGSTRHLDRGRVQRRGRPTPGRARRPARPTRPAGRSACPARGSTIRLRPTVPQQELDTRATTGVVYWEGSQVVTRDARRQAARRRGLRRADGVPQGRRTVARPGPRFPVLVSEWLWGT